MKLIKYLLLFSLFLLSSMAGNVISRKYKYRVTELIEFQNALNIFETKIKFTCDPIGEIFIEIAKNSSKNISQIFKNAVENMKSLTASKAWEKSVNESTNNLKNEDKDIFLKLSKLLGQADQEGQISQIRLTKDLLDKNIKKAEDEKNKCERLYKKLGSIVGLVIAIILC